MPVAMPIEEVNVGDRVELEGELHFVADVAEADDLIDLVGSGEELLLSAAPGTLVQTTRRRGRRKQDPADARSKVLRVLCTPDQHAAITLRAEQLGTSASSYVLWSARLRLRRPVVADYAGECLQCRTAYTATVGIDGAGETRVARCGTCRVDVPMHRTATRET